MKFTHILSASVLAGAVLLSATACKPSEDSGSNSSPDTSTSATATPSATGTASATAIPAPASAGVAGTSGEVRVSAPTEVAISDVTNDSLKVSWKAPTNTVGRITQYSVLLKENGEVKDTYFTAETTYTATGLTSNTAYMVMVSAVAVSEDGSEEVTSAAVTSNTVVVRSPAPAEQPAAPVKSPAAAPVKSPETPAVNERNSAAIGKIVETANGYYRFVGSTGSSEKLKENYEKVKQPRTQYDDPAPTETELKQLVAAFPEGFQYFDTSSFDNALKAYYQLFARANQSERTPGTVVTVPAEAVTVDGDKATIDSAKVLVKSNGKAQSSTEAPYFENAQLNFVKKSDGSWVMIAENTRHSIR
jgi:hypothetical protein